MKRVKNSDIKFKINKKLVYLPNFVIRFYTVNQKEYFFEKTQDDLVEYEREATVDDVEVILSGGTTVTEYYLPLNWSQLMFVGQGILNYKLTNNIEDSEFPDHQYNKEEVVTTDFYIDSIKVDPEPDEGLIERVVHLEEHLAEEIVNREEADAAISGAVDSEIARAISAETALQEALDAEETRATEAEAALDAKIDQEIQDRKDDVDAEETRAINAESALTDTINAETNRATSAETALDTKITQEIVDREADVDAEEARAKAAETALDAKIDAETNRATSAETALQSAINDEATARANADTALQTAITNEVSRAREAESGITNSLNAEVTRATAAENALDTKIDAETTRATGAEAALDVKIDTVSGNVISETTRATTAENALSGAIDSISAATSGSVEELDAKIDQEIADRTADVDAEEGRAKGVEDVLSGAIDTIDAKFIDDAKYEMSGQTHVINFYNGNVVKATIDCTDFLVDGMIDDVRIENGYLVIDFNTASGKQDIRIPLTDIFNPANYYTKSETSGATEIANALALKLNISDFNTYSGAVDTLINSKASQSSVDALSGTVIGHTSDSTIHLTSGDVQTQIDNSISGKANSSDVYLKSETSGATEISTALSGKQATLVSSENIKTINNESILGSGNIDIQGGGKAVSAGTNISITTGTTADTINCTIPFENDNNGNLLFGYNFVLGAGTRYALGISQRSNVYSTQTKITALQGAIAIGNGIKILGVTGNGGEYSVALGNNANVYGVQSTALGVGCNASGNNTLAIGRYSASKGNDSVAIGNQANVSGNSSVAIGRLAKVSGDSSVAIGSGATANGVDYKTNINNQLTIDTSNQVYIYNKDNTEMICLQDQLGGGGITSGEVQSMIESATTPIYQTIEDNEEVTAEALNVLNAALSGKADSSDVYLKSETSGATEIATAFAATQPKLSAGTGISIDANNVISATGGGGGGISSAECQTMIDQSISGKTNQTDFVSHSGNTSIHVTTAQTAAWDAKSDFSGSYNDLTDKPTIPNYTAGSGITISNNVISAKIWSGTEAQYNALAVKDNDTIYLIYNS